MGCQWVVLHRCQWGRVRGVSGGSVEGLSVGFQERSRELKASGPPLPPSPLCVLLVLWGLRQVLWCSVWCYRCCGGGPVVLVCGTPRCSSIPPPDLENLWELRHHFAPGAPGNRLDVGTEWLTTTAVKRSKDRPVPGGSRKHRFAQSNRNASEGGPRSTVSSTFPGVVR